MKDIKATRGDTLRMVEQKDIDGTYRVHVMFNDQLVLRVTHLVPNTPTSHVTCYDGAHDVKG